jgi:hypothetical protein
MLANMNYGTKGESLLSGLGGKTRLQNFTFQRPNLIAADTFTIQRLEL